ncbi:MAG: porin family protein [Alphaproteobacteria bacterium]|nr:porin family protein [Alphaproteobacteria bacterium]
MRRLAMLALCASVGASFAGAADAAPRKRAVHKAPPPMPEIERKTNYPSFYLGVHLGGGWSHLAGDASASPSGVIGGLQAGLNYQVDNLVFGAETELSAAGMSGGGSGTIGGTSVTGSAKHDWFATLAGRFGVASGRTLYFLKGGVAWTEYKRDYRSAAGGTATDSGTRTGWLIGFGIEHALTETVSGKIEYNYMDFGSSTVTPATTGGIAATAAALKIDTHVVKVGLNQRFTPFR